MGSTSTVEHQRQRGTGRHRDLRVLWLRLRRWHDRPRRDWLGLDRWGRLRFNGGRSLVDHTSSHRLDGGDRRFVGCWLSGDRRLSDASRDEGTVGHLDRYFRAGSEVALRGAAAAPGEY